MIIRQIHTKRRLLIAYLIDFDTYSEACGIYTYN